MTQAKKPDFETMLAELTDIVKKLETGGLSLEHSIKQFEQGIALTKACQKTLQSAEQQVNLLLSTDEEQQLVDFHTAEVLSETE